MKPDIYIFNSDRAGRIVSKEDIYSKREILIDIYLIDMIIFKIHAKRASTTK